VDLERESIWISYCSTGTWRVQGRISVRPVYVPITGWLAPVSPWERLKIGGGTPPVLTTARLADHVYHGVCDLADASNTVEVRQLCATRQG
jgi:hypothetical protein